MTSQAHIQNVTDDSVTQSVSTDLGGSPWAPIPTLTILAHPCAARIGEVARLGELAAGRAQSLSRHEPHFCHPGLSAARSLEHRSISRRPLRFIPGAEDGEIRLVLPAGGGHIELDGSPLVSPTVLTADRLESGVALLLGKRITVLLHLADPTCSISQRRDLGFVGESDAIIKLRGNILRAAQVDVPVVLRGETGTGKELVARALHGAGPRRRRPFVAVNMGAIAPNLAASELFGSVRGAFTGASHDRKGIFEAADGGTLFLDEIGEAPPEVRAALLRVLETGEVQPVGSTEPRRVDVRLIAATDRDLEEAVDQGSWSRALLHRLAGWEIRLPSLAQRREDLGRLTLHFAGLELRRLGEDALARDLNLDPRLLAAMARHPWPGNVRELRNIARELAVAAIDGGGPGPQALRLLELWPVAKASSRSSFSSRSGKRRRPSEIPHDELLATLEAHDFQLKGTAGALGISRTSLYQLIQNSPELGTAGDLDPQSIRTALAKHGNDWKALARRFRVSPEALKRRAGIHM